MRRDPRIPDDRTKKISPRDQVLELLESPTAPNTLRTALGVTKQRVHQILAGLEAEGMIVRQPTPGERSTYVVMRADRPDVSARLAARTSELSESKAQVLSSLRPDRAVRVISLAEQLGVLTHRVTDHLRVLEGLGLVTVTRLGRQHYALLTASGAQHSQYKPTPRACRPADIASEFGLVRSTFLRLLADHGPLKTAGLTRLSPPGLLAPPARTPAHYVQLLEREGLIARRIAKEGHNSYDLTASGHAALALIELSARDPISRA